MKFGLLLLLQDPPNGERIAALYDEVFEAAEAAERVGFDGLFVPEHHQMPDGYMPQPLTFAAALAARTTRMEIGTAILQLPLFHPLHVAEQGAVIDNVCKGRFILGAGLGLVEQEFDAFGLRVSDAVSRFEESVAILREAWSGASFSHDGKHFAFRDVTVTPRPMRPPPVWVGAMSEPSLARAGRIADGWLSDPLHNFEVMKAWADLYRSGASAAGNRRTEVAIVRDAWVGESEAEVERVWWPHVREFHLFYLNLGFFSSGRFNSKWEPWVTEVQDDDDWTYERVAPGRLLAGSAFQVIEHLKRYEREVDPQYMIMILRHPGGPSHEETLRCIDRFGREVLPHFR